MNIADLSVTFHTDNIVGSKEFYRNVLGGKVTFDCGWYVVFTFGDRMDIAFMVPQHDNSVIGRKQATINFQVEDVDAEYLKLKRQGVDITMDIADRPWGDRSFGFADPMGNIVYIYSFADITGEYKNAVKE
ncbi:MAG: VOC family protein [Breznakibacter sp.]